ncbi:hypothetical protein ACWGJP_10775 [Microbacterium sp. NPDC055903]
MNPTLTAIVAAALIALGMTAAPPAVASEHPLDDQVQEMLDAIPGGIALSSTHAIWPELGMDLVIVPASASLDASSLALLAAVGACPSGRVCAFSQAATAGSRLSWTTCDTSFPVGTFVVRSIADARSTGYAQAKYGTTVRGTASAGSFTNIFASVTRVSCVS